MTPHSYEQLITESTRLMQDGIALLESGHADDAIPLFAAASRLRELLPWRTEPHHAWLLAAARLNHGDALQRATLAVAPAEIVRCYQETIAAMETVPLSDQPAYVDRLILAWLNLASCHAEQAENADHELARQGFAHVEQLFSAWGHAGSPARSFLHGMFFANRGKFLITDHQPTAAMADACRAAEMFDALGSSSAAIKAVSLQCRCLAEILETQEELSPAWVAAATAALRRALSHLSTHPSADPWVADLIRFGARIYRVCEPQELRTFLAHPQVAALISNDPELHQTMRRELIVARMELEQRVLHHSLDPDYIQRQVTLLRHLQSAEVQLERHAGFTP